MHCGFLLTHPCTWAQQKQQTEDWRNLYNKNLQNVFYSSQHCKFDILIICVLTDYSYIIQHCKVKFYLSTVQIHTREWRYSSTHSQHQMEMGGELHAPTAIFLIPIVIRDGSAPEPVWKLQRGYKCLAKAWSQTKIPRLSNPQPSHYINCTNLAPKLTLLWRLNHEG